MANYSRWYRTGFVTVTKGSKSVTGIDTFWLSAGISPGDIFSIDNTTEFEIDSVIDNTHLTLKDAYTGNTGAGSSYRIIRNFTATLPAQLASQTALLLGDFRQYIDNDMKSIHGKSAYEIARDHGYNGTEQEWLNYLIGAGQWQELKTSTETTLAEFSQTVENTKTSMTSSITSNEKKVSDSIAASEKKINDSLAASEKKVNDSIAASEQKIQGALDDIAAAKQVTDALEHPVSQSAYMLMHHRNYLRAKYLGDKITPEQIQGIKGEKFTDLYAGDYWVVNDHGYYIADMGCSMLTSYYSYWICLWSGNIVSNAPYRTADQGMAGNRFTQSNLYLNVLPELWERIKVDLGDVAQYALPVYKHEQVFDDNGDVTGTSRFTCQNLHVPSIYQLTGYIPMFRKSDGTYCNLYGPGLGNFHVSQSCGQFPICAAHGFNSSPFELLAPSMSARLYKSEYCYYTSATGGGCTWSPIFYLGFAR